MRNLSLVEDYLSRSQKRLKAVQTLFDEEAWADVVRESQEVLELTLKALLRASAIEAPRIHDVSAVLEEHKERLPKGVQNELEEIVELSRSLRRDRELAFYGSEDLTPSEFYSKKDANAAFKGVKKVVELVVKEVDVS